MEVKSTRQVTVYDAPTRGSYTLLMPHAQEPMTVSAPTGYVAAKQLASLFPDCEFIYEKDSSYVWDSSLDRLVRDKIASNAALFNAGTALLEQTLHNIRREINVALDENRQPDYVAYIDRIASAFNTADRYFWILEGRQSKPKATVPPQKTAAPAPKVRSPEWPKRSSDYDGDADWTSKYYKDIIAKGLTKHTLPFGVGYSFDGDINDIEKLTKELEALFKGVRR
jgi:hypothetical protein